ncbi:MAG: RNA methyltransferase [Thermogutta sp.]|nr:RNA methyltransferase [Thermogutta sp.]HOP76887.1 RNA methyltransferase [Thermogutta sp.]HPU05193.1 RNA methyltransferase [Thermogutta sp.]HQF13387.1 RNA methyltransferase [Thermogutta sp.]
MSRSWIRVDSLDDPRLAPYRNLPERTLRGESIFITEGWLVTERLLKSTYETESVLLAEDCAAEYADQVPDSIPLYVGPRELLYQVVGYQFHQGVLAVGRRRILPSVRDVLPPPDRPGPLMVVVCPQITKPENIGLVFRSAAAFDVDAVILGERCAEPFSRRILRVSMGAVLHLPMAKTNNLREELAILKREWNVALVASVLDPTAVSLPDFSPPERVGLLLGHETEGLREGWADLCDYSVTIPMSSLVDSLNLGVAAGIFLYEFRRNGLKRRSA